MTAVYTMQCVIRHPPAALCLMSHTLRASRLLPPKANTNGAFGQQSTQKTPSCEKGITQRGHCSARWCGAPPSQIFHPLCYTFTTMHTSGSADYSGYRGDDKRSEPQVMIFQDNYKGHKFCTSHQQQHASWFTF